MERLMAEESLFTLYVRRIKFLKQETHIQICFPIHFPNAQQTHTDTMMHVCYDVYVYTHKHILKYWLLKIDSNAKTIFLFSKIYFK